MVCGLFGSDVNDGRYLFKVKHLKIVTEITSTVILVKEVQLNGMDVHESVQTILTNKFTE